jgi:HEAT repeat protein
MRYTRWVSANVRRLNLVAICLCAGTVLSTASTSWAQARAQRSPAARHVATEPSPEEQQVEALLGLGVETSTPVSAYAALGDAGTRALIAIFERETAARHVRLRALSTLGALESDIATRYLLTLLEARDATHLAFLGSLHPMRSASVLRRTLHGLERHHEQVAMADLMPYLAHRDPSVRTATVRLLARKPGAEITEALLARRTREPSSEVVKALTLALKDRSAPPASPRPDGPRSDSRPH